MKIKGDVVERFRAVLGGKAPTATRIEELLDELEQRREAERMALGETAPAPVAAVQEPEPEPDEEVEEEDDELEREDDEPEAPAPPQAVTAPPVAFTPPPTTDPEKAMLYRHMAMLEQRITELMASKTKQDAEQAIVDGKLPVGVQPAAPLGTPKMQLGPKGVFRKACDCGTCTPFRVHHWYCVICRSGPHHWRQRYPAAKKEWYAPGSATGIVDPVCSQMCWAQYLGLIGVVAGVNDHEPPQVTQAVGDDAALVAALPPRPAVPLGSD